MTKMLELVIEERILELETSQIPALTFTAKGERKCNTTK